MGGNRNESSCRSRHGNPHVSLTIPIAKGVPFLPWIKIPAAAITFAGEAKALENSAVNAAVLKKLYHDVVSGGTFIGIQVAVWLIVKGFNSAAITSLSAKTAAKELLSAAKHPDLSAIAQESAF